MNYLLIYIHQVHHEKNNNLKGNIRSDLLHVQYIFNYNQAYTVILSQRYELNCKSI